MADAHDKQQQEQASLMGFGFEAAAASGSGGDLFDGLPLDYAFLDPSRAFAMTDGSTKSNSYSSSSSNAALLEPAAVNDPFGLTPRMSAHLLSTIGGGGSDELMRDDTLFDDDVPSTGISGTTPRMSATTGIQQQQDDMLTPLPFAFSPSPVRYHPAPQHKHKRVRSNPDVLMRFQQQQHVTLTTLMTDLDPVTELEPAVVTTDTAALRRSSSATASPVRPSLATSASADASTRNRTVSNELATAVFASILNDFQDPSPLPSVAIEPIGPVEVTTPRELSVQSTDERTFQDMDAFLQDLSWADLTTVEGPSGGSTGVSQPMTDDSTNSNGDGVSIDATPATIRSQRIHAGVEALQMKRKRPTHQQSQSHARHHSNPVDLLHNLDQFRLLAQQTKQQQQLAQLTQQDPTAVLNPLAFALPSQQSLALEPAPVDGAPYLQFQVPQQIARGAVRSLHDRRASLPSAAGFGLNASATAKVPPRAAARRAQRSTGLSMDLSHMNLGFLSVPEEALDQSMQTPQLFQKQDIPSAGDPFARSTNFSAANPPDASDDANRKLYKCGRCGQPKVGHICTMPDQRNNWTQVDLDVTKGTKVLRSNCHILPVKSKWTTQHDENVRDEQLQQPHVSMLSA